MTRDELARHLSVYSAGLEAELSLLRQVRRLSDLQREAGRAHDLDRLHAIADDRERLMRGVVEIEHEIRPVRLLLAEHRAIAITLGGYQDVATLHTLAGHLVNEIISSDGETMAALRDAEAARRLASQALETGENTLAAYRRVVSPDFTVPSLVDKRG